MESIAKTVGAEISDALAGFLKVIEAGEPLSSRFRVTTLRSADKWGPLESAARERLARLAAGAHGPRDIANRLLAHGALGCRDSKDFCPIANYVGLDGFWISMDAWGFCGRGSVAQPPHQVRDFLLVHFDLGWYSDLRDVQFEEVLRSCLMTREQQILQLLS